MEMKMSQGQAFPLMVLLVGCSVLVGCGGSSGVSTSVVAPSITSISPSSIQAGSGPFNLLVSGQGLSTSSMVHFGNDVLKSAMAQGCAAGGNCTTISVLIPAVDVTTAGNVNVSVSNGGLSSNTVVFTVAPQPASQNTPQIVAFLPTIAQVGGGDFKMVILGVNVASNAVVNFGGLQLMPTSVLNCNSVEICPEIVAVPASAIASAGQVSLSLTNPGASGGTSTAVRFTVLAKTAFPVEESVNDATPPASANGDSTHSSASAGGAFVAFDSTATNLVAGATSGLSQVYLRNNCFAGQPNCVSQTILISSAPDGSAGSGGAKGSDRPVISVDGRFVAFESDDTNLIPGVTPPVEQIYLRDTCNSILGPVTGCTPSTALISASSAGTPGNGPSLNPTLSAFGFFVAFQSTATNLVSTMLPTNVSQIYLSRQCPSIPVLGQIPGCAPSLSVASLDANGNPGDKSSTSPSLDAIGLVLSFESLADNVVPATPGNGFEQIYVRNTCFQLAFPGIPLSCGNVTEAVSVDATGKLGTGDSISPSTGILALAIAFATRAPNLLPASTSSQQIIGRTSCVIEDTLLLPCGQPQSIVVSVDQNGVPGQADSSNPVTNGQEIAFTSLANLLPNISGSQVYLAKPCLFGANNCSSALTLVSADANGKSISGDFSAIEGAGTFLTFATTGSNGSAGKSEIFLALP